MKVINENTLVPIGFCVVLLAVGSLYGAMQFQLSEHEKKFGMIKEKIEKMDGKQEKIDDKLEAINENIGQIKGLLKQALR